MGRASQQELKAAKHQWQQAQNECERFEANGEKLKKLEKEQDALHMDYIKLVQQQGGIILREKEPDRQLGGNEVKNELYFQNRGGAEPLQSEKRDGTVEKSFGKSRSRPGNMDRETTPETG